VLPWVVAAIGALVVVLTRMPRGHRPTAWLAFALTAVMLTSLGTRPAAIWTAEREIQTETGIVRPTTALPGAAAPSADLEQRQRAAAWLVDRAAADDIVATSDPLSAFIPAQTGLRMYLAGDRYQEGLGDAGDLAEVEARRAVAAALAAGPTAGSIDALCSAGVRWVWIEGTSDWPSAYSEPGVQIADISELCG
jgi:hypothetical protein